jgi:hypothetical protein
MNTRPALASCDLAELFMQLERADAVSLQQVQAELARMLWNKTRQQSAESGTVEAPSSRLYHG